MPKQTETIKEDSAEFVAAFTAAAKEQIESPFLSAGASAPLVSRRMRESRANSNLTKIRSTPLTQDLVFNAAANLQRVKEQEKARRDHLTKVEAEKYVFFLICRRYNHQGLYFTANPKTLGQICDKDWYASWRVDKDGKADFSPYRGRIYCQGCYEEFSVKEELPIVWADEERGIWRPEEAYAYMQAMDPMDFERDGSRAIRIFELREEGSNRHFDELEAQREKWDAEHKKTEKVGA